MLFDGPARKAEEGYGKYEERHDHYDDDDDDDNDDDNYEECDDDDDADDHLYLNAVRLTGLTGRTLTVSLSGCSGT